MAAKAEIVDGEGGFADEGGHQLKPELEMAPVDEEEPTTGDLLVLDDEDDVPLRPQDVDRQLTRTARLAALDPDDGIAL
jgi:type IV secretion system protein VirD4